MIPLTVRLKQYIAMLRSLGFDLSFAERVLRKFAESPDRERADHITVDLFLHWKEHYGAANNLTWTARLSMVRVFAGWLQGFDPRTEVPPPGLITSRPRRARPYIYTDAQVAAIVTEAGRLPSGYGLVEQAFVSCHSPRPARSQLERVYGSPRDLEHLCGPRQVPFVRNKGPTDHLALRLLHVEAERRRFLAYFGAASSIASRRRFSSLSLGYRADRALESRRKSGLRSISDFSIVRSAFALPDFCSSIAMCIRSSVVVPGATAGASSDLTPDPSPFWRGEPLARLRPLRAGLGARFSSSMNPNR